MRICLFQEEIQFLFQADISLVREIAFSPDARNLTLPHSFFLPSNFRSNFSKIAINIRIFLGNFRIKIRACRYFFKSCFRAESINLSNDAARFSGGDDNQNFPQNFGFFFKIPAPFIKRSEIFEFCIVNFRKMLKIFSASSKRQVFHLHRQVFPKSADCQADFRQVSPDFLSLRQSAKAQSRSRRKIPVRVKIAFSISLVASSAEIFADLKFDENQRKIIHR